MAIALNKKKNFSKEDPDLGRKAQDGMTVDSEKNIVNHRPEKTKVDIQNKINFIRKHIDDMEDDYNGRFSNALGKKGISELNKWYNSEIKRLRGTKAQDETIQITRGEWDEMQESLSQLQQFMNDLVEGNLEIEIIDDDGKKDSEEEVEIEEIEAPEEEGSGEEEVEVETEEEVSEEDEEAEEAEDEAPEEKAEDEINIEEALKDPKARELVMAVLKASDKADSFTDMEMYKIRKRVTTATKKLLDSSMDPKPIVDKVMEHVKAARKADGYTSVGSIMKAMDSVNSPVEEVEKTQPTKKVIKRKTIKKSVNSAIPDFTSRFNDSKKETVKAVDEDITEDYSTKFSNRFN